MAQEFKALLVEQPEKKVFTRNIVTRSVDDLPEGDLLVRVHYSSLNFKDALSAVGNPGVTRNFPHTPGIDAARTLALRLLAGDLDWYESFPGEHDIAMTIVPESGEGRTLAEAYMFQLAPRLGREVAHDRVYDAALRSKEDGTELFDVLRASARDSERIDELTAADYLGQAIDDARAAVSDWRSLMQQMDPSGPPPGSNRT